jgi:tryptophanyl-tRNA synthetase
MTRVFSGIQPTGTLHLGNYLGAIRNWVALQERADFECIYCVVDYHAITVEYAPGDLPQQSLEMARDLLACGIDPERSVVFAQSQMPQHTELAWVFQATSATYGELQRMTQFKAKAEAQEVVTAGLFTYPILQAADILLYDAERVPVGEDQVQHLELTREIARRFNNRYGDTFPDVQPLLTRSAKILSLKDPTQKMSKSAGPGHALPLDGTEDEIRGMVKRAVTDVGPLSEGEMSPGVANLFTILLALEEQETHESLMKDYRAGSLKYVALKGAVSDAVWNKAAEIQARKKETPLEKVREILRAGAERIRPQAQAKMVEVRKKIGLASF